MDYSSLPEAELRQRIKEHVCTHAGMRDIFTAFLNREHVASVTKLATTHPNDLTITVVNRELGKQAMLMRLLDIIN